MLSASGAYSPHRNPRSQLLSSPFSTKEVQAEEWSRSRSVERHFLSPIVKTALIHSHLPPLRVSAAGHVLPIPWTSFPGVEGHLGLDGFRLGLGAESAFNSNIQVKQVPLKHRPMASQV